MFIFYYLRHEKQENNPTPYSIVFEIIPSSQGYSKKHHDTNIIPNQYSKTALRLSVFKELHRSH